MQSKKTILICLAAAIGLASCNSAKKIEQSSKSQEIIVPFSESKYKSDKDNFRAKNSGKSPDLATAKKIALQNAKAELASNIKTLIKRVNDQYTNQITIDNKQEFENKFEESTREVVSQSLAGVKLLEEKIFRERDGAYTYWVVIEVTKQSLLEGVNNKISKNERLKLEYDKKKFEEIYEREMEKLLNEQ